MWSKVTNNFSWNLPSGEPCCMSSQSFLFYAIPVMMSTKNNPRLSLLSTVIEDLPQTVLAINVARSMKHWISGLQILKASYGMIEPITRIVKISCDSTEEKNTTYQNTCTKCQKWLDVAFSVILCLCSFVLFISVMSVK